MEVEDGYYFSTINEYLNLPKTNYAIQLNYHGELENVLCEGNIKT